MKKKDTSAVEMVEKTYETEIEFVCPVRGKVKQLVTVKRLIPIEPTPDIDDPLLTKNIALNLDSKYLGLLANDDSLEDDDQEKDVDHLY